MEYPITVYIHSTNLVHEDGTCARIPLVHKATPYATVPEAYFGVFREDIPVNTAIFRARLKSMSLDKWLSRRGYVRMRETTL